jgi:hypothetical protein
LESEFRPPTAYERRLFEKLLEDDFPGGDELRQQLESVTVRRRDEDGNLELAVVSGPAAPVRNRVPTEGMYRDADGLMVFVLLHVVGGKMKELEVFKENGSKVLRPPAPEALDLFHPGPLSI